MDVERDRGWEKNPASFSHLSQLNLGPQEVSRLPWGGTSYLEAWILSVLVSPAPSSPHTTTSLLETTPVPVEPHFPWYFASEKGSVSLPGSTERQAGTAPHVTDRETESGQETSWLKLAQGGIAVSTLLTPSPEFYPLHLPRYVPGLARPGPPF